MSRYDKEHAKFILANAKLRAETAGVDWSGKHFIGLSGGKDSSAAAAFAEYVGVDYTAFVCDTDHEKPVTVAYLSFLKEHLKGEVRFVQHEVSAQEFEDKRRYIRETWSKWNSPALRSKAKAALGVRLVRLSKKDVKEHGHKVVSAMEADGVAYKVTTDGRMRIPLRYLPPEAKGSHKDLDIGDCGIVCEVKD